MMQRFAPQGFYFHPTNRDLIVTYLRRKNNRDILPTQMIDEVNLYEDGPMNLFADHRVDTKWVVGCDGLKRRYIFNKLVKLGNRHYVRAAGNGTWKVNGSPEVINLDGAPGGYRKNFVYVFKEKNMELPGRWFMAEYSLEEDPGEDFVLSVIKLDPNKSTRDY